MTPIADSCFLSLSSFVVVIILTLSRPSLANEAPQLPFEGQSFSLRSSVTVINLVRNISSNSPVNSWSQIYESYSVEQQRAKLVYKSIVPTIKTNQKAPELGRFYYDAKSGLALLYNRYKQPACQKFSVDGMQAKLAIDFYRNFEPEEKLAEKFIVGPARLLFFIARNRYKLKLNSLGEPVLVRNIPTLMYSLNYNYDKLKKPARFGIYYSEAALARDSQSIPLQVIIETDELVRIIDFSQLELIDSDGVTSVNNQLIPKSGTSMDQFAFPLFNGCSKTVEEHSVSIIPSKPSESIKFSFKSQSKFSLTTNTGPVSTLIDIFVAYDGALNSMRTDSVTPTKTGVRRQIFNFQLNRMYHSVERYAGSKNSLDRVLDLSNGDADGVDSDAISETTQCMVARIRPIEKEEAISASQLLMGADKFVYMGKAQVMGMPALVYEASNARIPFWFDQPVQYKFDNQSCWRRPEMGARKVKGATDDTGLSVVIYLSEQGADHSLLQIEMDSLKATRQIVKVDHFVWSLDKQAPNGDRAEEMFSLEDLCSAGMGKNTYAKVNMLLGPDDMEPSTGAMQTLENRITRDMALLASLQSDLKLAATMIYDLESKLIKPTSIMGPGSELQPALMASFRVAKHVDRLAELLYIGQGRMNAQYAGPRITLYLRTFHTCFFLAAHRRANAFFGYHPNRRICSIDLEPIVGPSVMVEEHPPSFTIDEHESMEIYRVNHIIDPILSTSINTWIEDNSHFKENSRLVGKKLDLTTSDGSVVSFRIKSLHLDDRDYKTSIAVDGRSNDNGQQGGGNITELKTNQILGFGLPEIGPRNRRVAPASLQTSNRSPLSSYLEETSSTMTYGQCQAACLSDYDCQSFSICTTNRELQCVVSSISFRSQNVTQQLVALATSQAKVSLKAKRVQITLDNSEEKVTLIQHQNCELYNKIFMNLFDKPTKIMQTFSNRRVYAVRSEEDCAQMCVKRNIEVLRNDISRFSDSYAIFAEASAHPSKDKRALLDLFKSHKYSNTQLCKAFLYWDRDRLSIQGKHIEEAIQSRVIGADEINFNAIDGYCMVGERATKTEIEELGAADKYRPHELNNYVQSDIYQFKVDTFYEKQYGVKLKASHMTARENRAYKLARRESYEADEQTYSILRSLIILGDNFQDRIGVSESRCALVCFMQSWGPWPACRSFDVRIEKVNNKTTIGCYLNSITMHQAIATQRFDLIDDSKQEGGQFWHFEPRPGFALEEGDFSENRHLFESDILSKHHSTRTISSLGVSIILILALTSGLVLGLYLGPKLIRRINDKRRDLAEKKMLVRRPTIVEFSNQVNANGKIQGE